MLRSTPALILLVFAGCVSTPAGDRALRIAPYRPSPHVAVHGVPETRAANDLSLFAPMPAAQPENEAVHRVSEMRAVDDFTLFAPMPAAQAESGLRNNRLTLKGGYYGSTEDAVDDGYILNLTSTRFLNNWLAIEFEVGYLEADGGNAPVETDVWAVPLMVNGRVNVPAWILDVYGGLGIGTFYFDAESNIGSLSPSADGWLLAGNAFLGASVNLADRFALGLEAKYYLTDEMADSGEGLDAFAVMLTFGMGF